MSKKQDAGAALGAAVVALVATVVALAVHGWLLMIVLGMMHSNYPEIPALGYGMSVNIVMLAYLTITPATAVTRK